MGHRELLLVLGALMLFSITMLSTNRYMADQNDAIWQREMEYYSLSLAQSFIEEATTRVFDEKEINGNPTIKDDFTDLDDLGPDDGEVYPNYDDVDDFNGFSAVDSTTRANFGVIISVGYVQENDPQTVVNSKEYFKKMTVIISNNYLTQPVQVSYVFGFINN